MALTNKTPDTIKATLKIKAQGVENTLQLTYKNHTQDEFSAFAQNEENFKLPESIKDGTMNAFTFANAQMVLFVVQSFDDGTDKDFPLTLEGLMKLEGSWPAALVGIIRGYHQARAAEVEKN